MPTVLQTIQLLVAPVVMISACGLLCLALYNRLAAIVSRARAFHKERFDAQARLATVTATERTDDDAAVPYLRRRVELLGEQVGQILRRAALVRNAVVLLLVTVLFMLFCSLALGMSLLAPIFAGVALVCFLLGVATAIVAMALAIVELQRALDPVLLEHSAFVELEGLEP